MTEANETNSEPPGDRDIWVRETAPQSVFSTRQVGIGFLVLLIGAIVVFGLPLALL